MANVFISHRSDDLNEAETFAREIQIAGHQVWLDEWEISIGDSIIEKINKGLEGTTYLILCYSSLGITTPWMSREWYSTLARQLNGAGVKIYPVKLTGGTPPAILADIKYLDLVKDWKKGLSELLKAIK
jgi:hypothetical protein